MEPDRLRTGTYLIQSRIPFIVFDPEGYPEEWNDAALQLFSALATAPKKKIHDFILQDSTPEEAIRFDYLLAENIPYFTFDFVHLLADGTGQWLKARISRQEDGRFFCLVDDITNQKQKETHLIAAKETAEKASMNRSQFLANISHEIRTPIQTIIGMMELLTDTRLDEEQTEYARQVRFSADVMLTLINDILDFSKVEAGQMKIEKIDFNLANVIESTVDLVSMEAHKKELEIIIDIAPDLPVLVTGDPSRLQQVILNLVKNAVKFTAKGQITVHADIRPRHGEVSIHNPSPHCIHFEVIDTGIGISPEVQAKLFTQFFQGDSSTTRKYGGTGLGLAISRNIVELMDGEIGVRNGTDPGSVFWFDIPLASPANQPPAEAIPVNPQTKFLLVDDNQQTLDVLARMLASLGYTNVTQATSGMFALAMLYSARQAKRPFDIVFIDMVMPEMDGWRLAAEINKNREINQAQLYLMVPEGSFGADAKMKLLEWFNGYLYKPIKRRMLADLLKNHWQSSIDLEVVEELESADSVKTEPVQEAPVLPEPVREQPGAGLSILVAEDHPVNRKLLKIFLEKAGASVVLAEDGQEATECMQNTPVDLVFMDIQMPRMNGYEATKWIRKNGYTQPIIACTASAQENEKERCLSFGMTDILPKPYKRQDVLDIMQKYTQPVEVKPVEPQNTSIFDAEGFFEIMMGDVDSGKVLLSEYIAQTESHMDILEEDIRAKTPESAKKTAHLIKGSSLNITAQQFAEAAFKIESHALELPEAELAALFTDLKHEFALLKKTLTARGYL